MYHKQAIENYPLQTYVSALMFSPKNSLIRCSFQHEEMQTIKIRPAMADDWGACRLTLEDHSNLFKSVVISGDSQWVVTGSNDGTAKIWETSSSNCMQTRKICINFDANDQFFRTKIGLSYFDVLSAYEPAAVIQAAEKSLSQNIGMSGDRNGSQVPQRTSCGYPLSIDRHA
jgi:WD40 repeat protein